MLSCRENLEVHPAIRQAKLRSPVWILLCRARWPLHVYIKDVSIIFPHFLFLKKQQLTYLVVKHLLHPGKVQEYLRLIAFSPEPAPSGEPVGSDMRRHDSASSEELSSE